MLRVSIVVLASLVAPAAHAALPTISDAPTKVDLPNAGTSIDVGLPERQQGAALLWKRSFRKFDDAEWAVTGLSLVVAAGSLAVQPDTDRTRRGGILFDESARRALRPGSMGWRLGWRDTSDVFLSVATTYPYLVDSLLVAWWHRGSGVVATQMALIDAEAMALTAAVQGLFAAVSNRERPFGRECEGGDLTDTRECGRANRYRSFFSGHTSQAFVAAALTCAHHANIPLYGNALADRLSCVGMFGLATAVGMLRVVSDQHYLSDVIVGAFVGTAIGFAVPYLLHYRPPREARGLASLPFDLGVTPTPQGIAITGAFL